MVLFVQDRAFIWEIPMRLGALALSFSAILLAPQQAATAQKVAAAPPLDAQAAIDLFAEAGFHLRDGSPVNRCGRKANPRVAFIDLNGDSAAEAHIADVDPACYGMPGAYFAILARQADGSWKRLIAEDGIVGFARRRSLGWNDLSLAARDSACPGSRRFNGSDYGAPTACHPKALLVDAGAISAGPAEAAPEFASVLTGSRANRLAELLANIVSVTHARTWDAAHTAIPGATWFPRQTHRRLYDGSIVSQSGEIDLGDVRYTLTVTGIPNQVKSITINGPANDNLEWALVAGALQANRARGENIGCHSPTGFGWVRIFAGGRSAIMHKFINYGTMVPSTDVYSFAFDDPFDGKTETQVSQDRSFC